MKFQFVEDHRDEYPIGRMCAVLGVSTSGYYAWRDRRPSKRAQANQKLLKRIREIHGRSRKTYGSPRVHAQLVAEGIVCNKKRVERLMREHDICAQRCRRRRTTTNSRHNLPVAPNLLGQRFTATTPNQKWVSDISYVRTREGWLYLAVVMDLYSRQIVGWSMGSQVTARLATRALEMAVATRRPGAGLIHHSDRGVQYASTAYQQILRARAMIPSMSRRGNCYDNAPMESFFGTLKSELVHHRYYQSRAEARTDIFAYIEGFYNRERLHSALGYQSPVQFERD